MACKQLKIGIFFDGTGNSKEEYEEYSNIAKLSNLYRVLNDEELPHESGKVTSEKIYVTGIGTANAQQYMEVDTPDGYSKYGYDKDEGTAELATGGGGAKRIYDTIDRVVELLDAHPYDKSDPDKFHKRELDVFGFSRGAAEARDFVNTLIEKKINKYPKKYGDVRFNFIGIFDTVGSFGIAGNAIDMKPKKEHLSESNESDDFYMGALKNTIFGSTTLDHKDDKNFEAYNFNLASSQAKQIVHITASQEVRHNFPLYSARGAAREFSCIGVHSDIGGGYGHKNIEMLAMKVTTENTHRSKKMEQRGWTYNPHFKSIQKQRSVDNALAYAHLQLMHTLASKAGVPLKMVKGTASGKVGEYASAICANPSQAEQYHDKETIIENFCHQSATHPSVTQYYPYPLRLPASMGEAVSSNIANVQNNMVQRAIYHNNTFKAVIPKKS